MSPTVATAGVRLLADHPIIDTVPFFLPAFLVVGVLVAIIVRDRRRQRREDEAESAGEASAERAEQVRGDDDRDGDGAGRVA